jgi:phosphoribosylanthranilate isomerase
MALIQVQIYEIQDSREADAVIGLGVDRIGSVILSEEKWKVPAIKETILAARAARVRHSLIPLFHTKGILFQSIDYYEPDIIHFCESLGIDGADNASWEQFVGVQIAVKERYPEIEIMRTIPIGTPTTTQRIPTLEIARRFERTSDYFLLDTSLGSEPVDGFIGITGRTGNWSVAREMVESSSVPVLLAGGLSPENVYEAVEAVRPFGVDSCTGTNTVDGSGKAVRFKKDLDRVKGFVQEVRRAERELTS